MLLVSLSLFEQFHHFPSMKPYDTQVTPASRSSALVSQSPHNPFLIRALCVGVMRVVAHRTTTIGVLYRRGAEGAWLLQWSIEEEKGWDRACAFLPHSQSLFTPAVRNLLGDGGRRTRGCVGGHPV